MGWGATQEDWLHFEFVLGLGADLLPVVSNPGAVISGQSRMKALGKTPSIYNASREVAGLAKWTERQATTRDLERWAKEEDYGICVQTRTTRGLDIDVPDVQLAVRIAKSYLAALGMRSLPQRGRAGSGKTLLAFALPGDLRKRSFKVEGGLVEFLATGQQFIAVGTHPSGTRYEWVGGLPDEIPTISLEQFERAWAAIVAEFAIEGERRSSSRAPGEGAAGDSEAPDDVAAFLEANWPAFGTQGGKLFVECPWKDGHSSDSGETEAAWLLAGTNGYAQGHFECLHASCSGRSDEDFLDAVGYRVAQFDDLPALYQAEAAKAIAEGKAPAEAPRLPLPGFERDKSGKIEPTIGNAARAAAHPEACGARIRFDTFRGELMLAPADADDWRPFEDADAVQMRVTLAALGFKPVGKELMRDAITLAARDKRFDTAQLWLGGLPAWDGVPRVEGFFARYFGAADNEYVRAVGAYAWSAQAGRVMDPGCKVDMVPVLVGDQGTGKSSGIAAMAPAADFFAEIDLKAKDDDLSRLMRGTLVAELAELRGLNTREAESIKAWVTKRFEKWTPKYQEYAFTFPRRLVFYGTTNVREFLADETGERRWLPFEVTAVDVKGIERDRAQLWAEGLALWRDGGVRWKAAEDLARGEHAAYRITDPWDERIAHWLDDADLAGETPRTSGKTRTADVLSGPIGLDLRHVGKREEIRVGKIMRALGMISEIRRVDGKPTRVWVHVS